MGPWRGDWLDGRVLDDHALAGWIARLHGQGLSAPTVALAVAAVRFRARTLEWPNPAGPVTGKTLAGIRRSSAGRGRGQVAGVTWEMADRVVAEAVRGNTLRGLRDAALIAVASDALLRVSELVAINRDDIHRDPDGSALLLIRRSKSDQEGTGATCYLGPRTVAVLDAWIESAGIGVNGEGFDREDKSVFRSVRKGGAVGSRLSDRSARAIVTDRCGSSVPGRVSGHSLRVGSAISLARAGASLVELQQAGRWKSPAMPALYTRGEAARRGPVARLRHGQENGRRPAAADPLEVGDLPVPASEEKENGETGKEPGRDAGGGPCAEPVLTPGIRSNGVKTTDSTTLRKACHAGSPPRARESASDRVAERYWPSGAMSIPVGASAAGPPAM